MRNSRALFWFVVALSIFATPSVACSPSNADVDYETATVTSSVPAKNVPLGAIQLRVDTSNYVQISHDYSDDSRIALQVKQVLNGKFSGSNVLLNVTNVDNCNSYFTPMGEYSYITVLPMQYQDGKPILDKQRRQEFGSLFYKDTSPFELENKKVPEFAEYRQLASYSFSDVERLNCLNKANQGLAGPTANDWRRCVTPDRYLALNCDDRKKKAC
jgi:hypothetical protein